MGPGQEHTPELHQNDIEGERDPEREDDADHHLGGEVPLVAVEEQIAQPAFSDERRDAQQTHGADRDHPKIGQENGTGQSWYEVKDKSWVKHVVSDRSYGHGIGATVQNRERAE